MLAQLAVGRTLGGGTLVVTHPLAAVVRAFCRSLTMALNGKMGGAAGTCFLLVGKRGTGKTSLLAALSGKGGALARAVGGGRVATLRLSMAHYHRSHPVRHLEVWLDFETPPLSAEEEALLPAKMLFHHPQSASLFSRAHQAATLSEAAHPYRFGSSRSHRAG